jgi:hypothetical protein
VNDFNTFARFLDSVAERKQIAKAGKDDGADDKTHPVFHHDEKTRKAIHSVLKATHKHVFNEKTKDLAEAQQKHAAVVALSEPDEKKDEK